MVTTKNTNVSFKRFTPAMRKMLMTLWNLDDKYGFDLVITSANDSTHSTHSRHYVDEGLDIRVHNLKDPNFVRSELSKMLGPRFTVLFESPGTPNQHIHIQPIKGSVYSLEDLLSGK